MLNEPADQYQHDGWFDWRPRRMMTKRQGFLTRNVVTRCQTHVLSSQSMQMCGSFHRVTYVMNRMTSLKSLVVSCPLITWIIRALNWNINDVTGSSVCCCPLAAPRKQLRWDSVSSAVDHKYELSLHGQCSMLPAHAVKQINILSLPGPACVRAQQYCS